MILREKERDDVDLMSVIITAGLFFLSKSLEKQKMEKRPLMMAALNGLYVTHMPAEHVTKHTAQHNSTDEWVSRHFYPFLSPGKFMCYKNLSLSQCQMLELKLEEERLFTEYEQIPKKKAKSIFTTATLPDNIERNRFRDVLPYEENRVELVPNKENNTGYINASHIKVGTGLLNFFDFKAPQCIQQYSKTPSR